MVVSRRSFVIAAASSALAPGLLRTAAAAVPTAADRDKAIARGIEYLRTKGQAADGSFTAQGGPGLTALVATSLMRCGITPEDPVVAKALAYLQTFVQPDGGIFKDGSHLGNYETCLAISCFAAANKDKKYDDVIKRADAFVKSLQFGGEASDLNHGGVTYGKQGKPDLSNTAALMEALQAAGNDKDSEAVKRALVFISRCQNLETEHNTAEFSAKNPDGGFIYSPIGGGSSPAGKTGNGGLRSYGSMTYAGLKSMVFAGLTKDDPRVKAATKWIQENYTLDANPGLGDAGLYYYYMLFARAMDALGQDTITDAKGAAHNWRDELTEALIARQGADGSWTNKNEKWFEGVPNLATGFALMALSYCRPKAG
jgi:squalene-hopene/tetraprenyl-beta-curcumene cyclase